MSLAYASSRLISRTLGLTCGAPNPAGGLRILMYHAIGSPVADDKGRFYSLSENVFSQHMNALAAIGAPNFTRLEGERSWLGSGPSVAVTFDDGYRDNLSVAAPTLAALGIPFSVFVIANAARDAVPGFLSGADVRRLCYDYGGVIGSHSATHARLATCGNAALREELVSSKAYLEDLLGLPVNTLSYPHGSVDRRVRDAAADAGYTLGLTSFFGNNDARTDPLLLFRLPVMRGDGVADVQAKIAGHWDWYRWRQRTARRAAGVM